MDIEAIAATLEALPPATGDQWHVATAVRERIHVSRTHDGGYAVFLEGAEATMGKLPWIAGVDFSHDVTALPEGRKFPALRIRVPPGDRYARLVAHMVYEAVVHLTADAELTNEDLLARLDWVLASLGPIDEVMPVERQKGLIGECVLLRELMKVGAQEGLSPGLALDRWWGYEPAHRDFAADGAAIEAKTTGYASRVHHIGSLLQLDPQSPGERCYLFSLGIRSDPSAPRRLSHFVADVEANLVTLSGAPDYALLVRFHEQLSRYGYDVSRREIHDRLTGYLPPHLEPALLRDQDLDRVRLRSFVGGELPTMVTDVSFDLRITADPLDKSEAIAVYRDFLRAAPLSRPGA